MSNSLLDKIKADGDAKAAEISAKSETAAQARSVETEAALKQLRSEAAAALKKEEAQRELVANSKAKQAHKLSVQQAKREAIDAIFTEAFGQLAQQSSEAYVSEYTARFKDVVPADATVTAVTAPEARRAETADILKAVHVAVEPNFTDKLSAGVVVMTNAGVYDLTLDRRFKEARAELEMQIVAAVNA